jgi:hypothetical protein
LAHSDTSKNQQARKPPIPVEERLAALAAAMPEPATGRVRSLEEARRALRIPTSAADEILQAWGIPKDFDLEVYPVAEPERPDLVAEFALLRVVIHEGRKLVAGSRHTRLRLKDKSNALWILYGSIMAASDGSLVLESLAVGPAFDGQLSREGDQTAHGITGQLLRLLSPPRILAACAERLLVHGHLLDSAAAQHRLEPMPNQQRNLLDRIDQGRPQHAKISDDQLAAFAARYLTLYHRGEPQLRLRLAREFGLTLTQARDRTNQARRRGYLTGGSHGRAGANPGPGLLEAGWQPQPAPSKLSDETTQRTGRGKTSEKTA